MIMLSVLVVFVSSSLLTAHEDVILRQNYGVVFEKVAVVENDADMWHHTFAIPLKTLQPRLKRVRACPPHKNAGKSMKEFCARFEQAFTSYNRLHTIIYDDILRVQDMVQPVLPN